MNSKYAVAVLAVAATLVIGSRAADPVPPSLPGHAVYRQHVEDPVLKKLEDEDTKKAEAAEKATSKIVDAMKAKKKKEKEEKKDLRINLKDLVRPHAPTDFKLQEWHFPPVPQYLTGTCWAFSTTSFFESEVKRITGQEIKLSEMWTVYHEYLEKAIGYIESRGNTPFSQGSESEGLTAIWKKYGVVPEEAYRGVLSKEGLYDHDPMVEEMRAYLHYCKAHNYWNEEQILGTLKLIMNRTMGAPPEMVTWKGEQYTPKRFLKEVLKLNMDDYVSFVSTESMPWWRQGEYKVEDNWRHISTYYNVPLDAWYNALLKAVKAGSSIAIGGDVSEPGYDGLNKVAVVAKFDLPQNSIDQDSREIRIYEDATTDDHGIHLVGWKRIGDHDWFLIKDSARASRKAAPKGYMFYRDDYVKLKMLSYMVHKDFVKELLERCAKEEAASKTVAKEAAGG